MTDDTRDPASLLRDWLVERIAAFDQLHERYGLDLDAHLSQFARQVLDQMSDCGLLCGVPLLPPAPTIGGEGE